MPPVVTVVIPCHNHEQWVGEAIESIKRQTHRNLRIVVVDDCSTDCSPGEVLDRFDAGFVKTEYEDGTLQCVGSIMALPAMLFSIPDRPRGPSFARNLGIKAAWDGTDYFAFLDSDDLYAPTKIVRSLQEFEKAPEHIGAVYSDYETLRSDSGLRIREYKPAFSRELLARECIVNCDSLVAKQALETCGLFDESMRCCEDFDLWMRLSERYMIAHVPEALVTVRVGDHSSTATVPSETWQRCYRRVFEKAMERAGAQSKP